jgi:hypothetical protein
MTCDICGASLSPDALTHCSVAARDGIDIEIDVCAACADDHPAFREKAFPFQRASGNGVSSGETADL